jgi:hypothetical protein
MSNTHFKFIRIYVICECYKLLSNLTKGSESGITVVLCLHFLTINIKYLAYLNFFNEPP